MNIKDVPSPIDFHDAAQARAWVEDTVNRRPARPRFFRAFADALNGIGRAPLRILEIGSGPGHLASVLLSECEIARYVALDFSAAMGELAKAHLGAAADQVEFLQRDFRNPDWNAGLKDFDAAVTMQAAHETRHRLRLVPLLRQIRDCLKRGNLFLYCDHYAPPPPLPGNRELYFERGEQSTALHMAGFGFVERLLEEDGMALYRAEA